jgi:hypothetical protein
MNPMASLMCCSEGGTQAVDKKTGDRRAWMESLDAPVTCYERNALWNRGGWPLFLKFLLIDRDSGLIGKKLGTTDRTEVTTPAPPYGLRLSDNARFDARGRCRGSALPFGHVL